MIRLLESQGELDAAIAEYDGLIRAAPNDPQFVFEECEALLQRGDRARALKLVTALEARADGDEDVLVARRGLLPADRRRGPLAQSADAARPSGDERPDPPRRPRRSLLPGRQHAARAPDVEADPHRRPAAREGALDPRRRLSRARHADRRAQRSCARPCSSTRTTPASRSSSRSRSSERAATARRRRSGPSSPRRRSNRATSSSRAKRARRS